MFVTTKLDGQFQGSDRAIEGMRAALDRLGTDYVDLLLIHWPSDALPMEESLKALAELRTEGKTRYIGVSNFTVALLKQAIEDLRVEQFANGFLLGIPV